jgi:hypothetical protein
MLKHRDVELHDPLKRKSSDKGDKMSCHFVAYRTGAIQSQHCRTPVMQPDGRAFAFCNSCSDEGGRSTPFVVVWGLIE